MAADKELIARARQLIKNANRRWRNIEKSGFYSRAISKARAEQGGRELFSSKGFKTNEQYISLINRISMFMSDETSTVRGANLYSKELSFLKYRHKFGNNWRTFANGYKSYDTSSVSELDAETAFRIYRKMEETEAIRLRIFGSDNSIAFIYDMVEQYYSPSYMDDQDIIQMVDEYLDSQIGNDRDKLRQAFEEENEMLYSVKGFLARKGKNGDYYF